MRFSVPILFVVFNRPETTAIVFNRIREIAPTRLYVAADGARKNKAGEDTLCTSVRNLIAHGVDWECEVFTWYREVNMGCKKGVSSAINWFFENEEEGVILEDDCLPDLTFFNFARAMLEKYRNDKDIIAINGCNFGFHNKQASYFFSRYMNVWGWATWRRSAKAIQYEIPGWNQQKKISFLRSRLKKQLVDLDIHWYQYWISIFDMISSGALDSWAYFWIYHQFLYRKKNIISSINLVKNIGFGDNATHTKSVNHPAHDLVLGKLNFPLVHPENSFINKRYEEEALKPVCYIYKTKPNSFYVKNMLLKIPGVLSISKALKKK